MLNKISDWLRRFMYGRYGVDQLTLALMVLGMLASLVTSLHRSFFFSLLYFAAIVLCFYRILSRDCTRRFEENKWFLGLWARFMGLLHGKKAEMAQRKQFCLFKCPQCGQKLRLPRGKGMVEVTCFKCQTKFQKKT